MLAIYGHNKLCLAYRLAFWELTVRLQNAWNLASAQLNGAISQASRSVLVPLDKYSSYVQPGPPWGTLVHTPEVNGQLMYIYGHMRV